MTGEFICPNDVGFLSSDLSTPEALEKFLGFFGIGVVFLADNKKSKPPKPQSQTPTKSIRAPEIKHQIRHIPNHKFPQSNKK